MKWLLFFPDFTKEKARRRGTVNWIKKQQVFLKLLKSLQALWQSWPGQGLLRKPQQKRVLTLMRHMGQTPSTSSNVTWPENVVVLSPVLLPAFCFDCIAGVHFNVLLLFSSALFFSSAVLSSVWLENRESRKKQTHSASIEKHCISEERKKGAFHKQGCACEPVGLCRAVIKPKEPRRSCFASRDRTKDY